ncbi:MAG: cytoplasmic protein [Colwelliaceae bacterium]|nr:cytoplasmic protein [Colwelliaceae bacterium]
MSITIGSTDAGNTNIDTGHALLTEKKVRDQQELEGQMAIKLIEASSIDSVTTPPVGNSGHNINIKA